MRHPDEGEIHAWLDGALDPAASAELEAHVAACAECAAAVAEARGLIAGASRILLALDGVPSGVIPAQSPPTVAAGGDELAVRREARRNVPWYARRPVRIAAGLILVVGVGGIVARESNRAADQVSVQFETDAPVAASKGPSAGTAGGSVGQSAAVSEVAAERAPTSPPPPAALTGTSAANQAPRRADQGMVSDLGAGAARYGSAEQREKSAVSAERAAVPPPPSAPGGANASFGAARLVTPPVPMMDSAVNAIVGRSDSLRSNILAGAAFAAAPGVITGKVIAADNSPLSNASVVVEGIGIRIGAQTATDGSFMLRPLPPGQYTVEARRIGYSPAKLDGVQVASGDTAYARLALKENALQLSQVVVTGAAQSSAQRIVDVVAPPNVAGACFVLDVDAGGDVAGIPLLPRRVRIRMAESPVVAELVREESKLARERAAALAPAAPRGYAGTPSEPTSPLPWQRVFPDSIGVTWATEADVITLRLQIRGDNVSGTARSSLGSPPRTAKVSGSKVTCGR